MLRKKPLRRRRKRGVTVGGYEVSDERAGRTEAGTDQGTTKGELSLLLEHVARPEKRPLDHHPLPGKKPREEGDTDVDADPTPRARSRCIGS